MGTSLLLRTATRALDAVVTVPGSKSIANRALACAALAEGVSHLGGLPGGDDTTAMLRCLRDLGVDVQVAGDDGVERARCRSEAQDAHALSSGG